MTDKKPKFKIVDGYYVEDTGEECEPCKKRMAQGSGKAGGGLVIIKTKPLKVKKKQ